MKKIRFCAAQLNTTVGDIRGNTLKVLRAVKHAQDKKADMIILPELALTGYPPEDLLLKSEFVSDNMAAARKIAKKTGKITAVLGFVNRHRGRLYNSAAVIQNKKIKSVYNKVNLPNYGVFDEKRYFEPGKKPLIISCGGMKIGITICEDIWQKNRILDAMKSGVDYIANLSASPYHAGKWRQRFGVLRSMSRYYRAGIVYVNLTGGQDELVFDGHSVVTDKKGGITAEAAQFKEDYIFYDTGSRGKRIKPLGPVKEVFSALTSGTRDYVLKNGFKKAVVALSGGIDSALVSVIAAEALGRENVDLIFMPSRFSSKTSFLDAEKLSSNMGIKLKVVSIEKAAALYNSMLAGFFKGRKSDITEENLQARIRGNIVMAFSNKFGSIVLTTGNKSEMSTGYATLYGDMAGGLAVIKDVPKTMVFKLARGINEWKGFDLIPKSIIKKPPSAELKPGQKDSDTLPPYNILDAIIEDYVEKDRPAARLKGRYKAALLKKTIRMIDLSEYKRRQAPPGIKITPKAFGRDRRMPVTNKYRD